MHDAPLEPPPPEDARDAEHLRMLRVFHFVWAALAGVFGCGFGTVMVLVASALPDLFAKVPPGPNGPPPEEFLDLMRTMYGGMGVAYGAGGVTLAVLALVTASKLRARRSRTFCMVASGFQCLAMPLGTALGVFTILVLSRASVARVFESRSE